MVGAGFNLLGEIIMETKRTIKSVKKECWSCNVPEHRHRKRSAAETCMKQRTGYINGPQNQKKRMDRMIIVIEAAISGKTLSQAGATVGVGSERTRQLLARGAKMIQDRIGRKISHGDIRSIRENKGSWEEAIAEYREVSEIK